MLLAGTGVFYFYFIEWIEAYIGRCVKHQMTVTEKIQRMLLKAARSTEEMHEAPATS